jgi:methylmalonyl-CoA mutase N-terminal domain/subunit
MMLRFHTQTGGSTLTAQQPMNNIARVTLQTVAAVLGGTQSLHTNGYDEALSLPTEDAARTALRTQQIVAFESGIADTVDPLAGSFFIESLTDDIEKKSKEIMDTIDTMGGSVEAIESGYMQEQIARSAYEYQRGIESGDVVIVGVNKFIAEKSQPIPVMKIDNSIQQTQVRKLAEFRAARNNVSVTACLEKIRAHAIDGTNLMPSVVEAVENNCTLGEIADTLRAVFGEHR